MRNKLLAAVFAIAGLLTFSSQAFAHHGSRISYNMNKLVTLTGTVTEFDWANPHVYCLFNVTGTDGKVTGWAFETDSPILMAKNFGWHNRYLKPGDKVTVTVWPSKVGAPRGFLAKLVDPNGKVTDHDPPAQ